MKPVSLAILAVTSTCLIGSVANAQGLSERVRAVADQKQEAAKADTGRGKLLGALLYTDMSVNFDKTPAKTAFEFIAAHLGAPMVARYAGQGGSEGIDPDLEITLNMENAPAITVIGRLLEMCGTDSPCTWQLREGFIEVGTKERLAVPAARELRMYPIRDLLFEPPTFDNAPQFNLGAAMQQGQGGQNGGGGGGSGGGGGGFGGGGGGGGFGGGGGGGMGGGGSGGSGGGGVIGNPKDDPERKSMEEKADQLMTIIQEQCEPEAWKDAGGEWATMRYYQGVLIVRAPDFIHRQIDGYPFAPVRPRSSGTGEARRYVTFTDELSIVQNVGFTSSTVQGATGGNGGGNVGSPIVGTDAASNGASNGAGKGRPANGTGSNSKK